MASLQNTKPENLEILAQSEKLEILAETENLESLAESKNLKILAETVNLKILAVTDDNNLVCYGFVHHGHVIEENTPNQGHGHIIEENILSEPFPCNSITPVIGNRYIFLVGGLSGDCLSASSNVFYFDRQGSRFKTSGPPLLGPKYYPTLIVMGSIIFAVSILISEPDPSTFFISNPFIEFLDTTSESDLWKWQTLSPFPFSDLTPSIYYDPDGEELVIDIRHLVAYVANESTKTLYLCLGIGPPAYRHAAFTLGTQCITYNLELDKWVTGAAKPLPFIGEGKVFNNLFYGFPPGPPGHPYSLLGVYQLESSNWVMLGEYSIFPEISLPFTAYCPSLYFPSEGVVAIVRDRNPNILREYDPDPPERVLDFVVVELPKMRARDHAGNFKTEVKIISRNKSSSWCSPCFRAVLGFYSDPLCW